MWPQVPLFCPGGDMMISNSEEIRSNKKMGEIAVKLQNVYLLASQYSKLCGTGWVVILTGGYPATRTDGR